MNNESVRLQKYLARCGIASRRASEKLILEGKISINDVVVTKMGTKVNPECDIVKYDGQIIEPKTDDVTIMLNKPCGYVSTMSDPQGRPCVADLIPVKYYPSIFPVGRLDRLTCGLLVFTTNGQLGQDLLHPKNEVVKTYEVVIDGQLQKDCDAYKKLESGVEIKSGKTSNAHIKILEYFDFNKYLEYENDFFKNCAKKSDVDALPHEKELLNKKFCRLEIQIHEGKNRQVRRMFEAVGFNVLLLRRKSIGNLKIGSLECGKWVKLEKKEIELMLT